MQKIKVWKEYSGNRCENVIPVAEYDPGDGALFGLESYLVANGNAVWFEAEAPKASIAPVVWDVTPEAEVIPSPKTTRGKRGK